MKKLSIYTFIIIGIILLSGNNEKDSQYKQDDYQICKIDSIKNWYLIYAVRNDSIFKIASMKKTHEECERIIIGKKYNFLLQKRLENVLSSNGLKMLPINYLHIEEQNFNDSTDIFIKYEEGVYGIYTCENLEEICFMQK